MTRRRASTRLDGAAYFVYGIAGRRRRVSGECRRSKIRWSARSTVQDIMRRAWGMDDGIFRYDVYELNLGNRWIKPQPNGVARHDVVIRRVRALPWL